MKPVYDVIPVALFRLGEEFLDQYLSLLDFKRAQLFLEIAVLKGLAVLANQSTDVFQTFLKASKITNLKNTYASGLVCV